jgi:hypothetical protein
MLHGRRVRPPLDALVARVPVRIREATARAVRRARQPRAVDVRLVDKLSFAWGVLGCSLTQWVFSDCPERMWLLYSVSVVPLLLVRLRMYWAARMQLFMLDFCYLVQMLLLAHIFLFPCSRALHLALFALASGPIGLAIVAWRNSLVFHSMDKVISIFIHLMPALTLHALHWHPASLCAAQPPGWGASDGLSVGDWLGMPLLVYALWQAAYVLCVDVGLGPAMARDKRLQTSCRVLTAKPHGGAARAALRGLRALRVFGSAEEYDADTTKTKAVFIAAQATFTTVTLVPVGLGLAASRNWHLGYIVTIYVVAVWNGAGYYFEVRAHGSPAIPRSSLPREVLAPAGVRWRPSSVRPSPQAHARLAAKLDAPSRRARAPPLPLLKGLLPPL